MQMLKVLIFTVTYEGKDYCLDAFVENALKIRYSNKKHIFIDNSDDNGVYFNKLKEKLTPLGIEVYRTDRGNNSREAIARAQNYARNIAITENYDYLFSLESDIFPPEDVLVKLLSHGKDVVTGLYYIGHEIKVPCITLPKWNKQLNAFGTRLLAVEELPQYTNNGLKRVAAGGMGCCLVYKRIFKMFSFYYEPRLSGHSDIYFFNDCFRKQIPVYVDTNILCRHINSKWDDVKDR